MSEPRKHRANESSVLDDGYRLSDDLWARIEPLLPPRPPLPLGGHNPRTPDRKAMDAILFVLRTGCQWNALTATGICTSSAEQAGRLVGIIEANTRTLAERTYGEFIDMADWTEEQRQNHALRAIVERVVQTVRILAPFGVPAQDAATHLMRETYFARLASVALGAQAGSGLA